MDRDGMEMSVRVGNQWISLDAYRVRKSDRREKLACIAFVIFLGVAMFVSLWAF